jgi:hypothetical protein
MGWATLLDDFSRQASGHPACETGGFLSAPSRIARFFLTQYTKTG